MFLHHFRKYRRILRLSELKQQAIEKDLEQAMDALAAALLIKDDQKAINECIFNSLNHLEQCSKINSRLV